MIGERVEVVVVVEDIGENDVVETSVCGLIGSESSM